MEVTPKVALSSSDDRVMVSAATSPATNIDCDDRGVVSAAISPATNRMEVPLKAAVSAINVDCADMKDSNIDDTETNPKAGVEDNLKDDCVTV